MDFQSKGIKLIFGLGNPGAAYANTYHNAGIIFLDYIANATEKNEFKKSVGGLFAYRRTGGTILAKNLNFMNEAGDAVKKAAIVNKIKPAEILLVHDDSDLRLGEIKFSFGRGAGGHKGVASTIKTLKTKSFWRLRIGIRPQREKIRAKAMIFVLRPIKSADRKILEAVFRVAAEKF